MLRGADPHLIHNNMNEQLTLFLLITSLEPHLLLRSGGNFNDINAMLPRHGLNGNPEFVCFILRRARLLYRFPRVTPKPTSTLHELQLLSNFSITSRNCNGKTAVDINSYNCLPCLNEIYNKDLCSLNWAHLLPLFICSITISPNWQSSSTVSELFSVQILPYLMNAINEDLEMQIVLLDNGVGGGMWK